jgi:hypothetical protein
MEDTLLEMTQKSVERFVKAMCWFVPHSTKVSDAYNVENTFYTEEELLKYQGGAPPEVFPLFHIDLELSADGKTLQYSSNPGLVVQDIMKIFLDGIHNL